MGIKIAIDGPSGAGKSTIAKKLSAKLSYVYVDTGALYRSIALYFIKNNIDVKDETLVCENLEKVNVSLEYKDGAQHVILNGEDVSEEIRTPEVSMGASAVSAYGDVRKFLLDLQKNIAEKNNVIMDGRDIGTVVLPDAEVKLFLVASPEERANRRYKELIAKGNDVSYEDVLKDINQRDYNDTHRAIAPLRKADDAIEIDSTSLTLEETIDKMYETVLNSLKKNTNKINYVPLDPEKRGKVGFLHIGLYAILRGVVWVYSKIAYNVKFVGKENIPKHGSVVIASNHRNYFDPVFVSIPTKIPCAYMAKEELFKYPVFSSLIRALGAFPVTRGKGDTGAIEEALKNIDKGKNLVIFPEGTRSKDGKLGRGKSGVALIASMAKTDVLPVAISFEGAKLTFRKKVIIRFGEIIPKEELEIKDKNPRAVRTVLDKIMGAIANLAKENENEL